MPKPLSEYENEGGADGITSVLVREIRTERVLLQRCQHEFQRRQEEIEPRPVPSALAEPLARIRAGGSSAGQEPPAPVGMRAGEDMPDAGPGQYGASGVFANTAGDGPAPTPSGQASAFANAANRGGTAASAASGAGSDRDGNGPAPGGADAKDFSETVDRSRVDQLLQRLQQGTSLF